MAADNAECGLHIQKSRITALSSILVRQNFRGEGSGLILIPRLGSATGPHGGAQSNPDRQPEAHVVSRCSDCRPNSGAKGNANPDINPNSTIIVIHPYLLNPVTKLLI
jgi:hypothetical protein